MNRVRWIPVVLLLVFSWQFAVALQSDELVEDDDEWGLVGGISTPKAPERASGDPVKSTINAGVTGGAVPRTSRARDASSKEVQFTLEHSLAGEEFSPAGVFTARLRESVKGGQTLSKFRLTREPFSTEEKKKFHELIDKDGFYKIRVPSNVLSPGKFFVISSVKARCLAESNFEERFDFQMDQGYIIGVTYGGTSSCPYPRVLRTPTQWNFHSLIIVKTAEQASRSLVAPEIVEVAAEGELVADDGTLVKKIPEKSFWAKYWMYIIPGGLILMNALTQLANLPEEGAQGQGTAGAQARVGGPARRR